MSNRRRTILTNTTGVSITVFRKRFSIGESFDIPPADLQLWRDASTISGLIANGDIIVGDSEDTFSPGDGIKWFYDHPSALPTSSGGAVQQQGDDFLTINRARFGFGKNGNTSGAYLRVEGAASTKTGHIMMRPAKLTAIAIYYPSGAAQKDFEIRINGVATALLTVTAFEDVPKIIDNLDIDFDTGDRVQAFVASAGQSVSDPNVWCEVAWRVIE